MRTRSFAGTVTLLAVALLCIGVSRLPFDGIQQHVVLIFNVGRMLLGLASLLALWSLYRTGGFRHSPMGRRFLLLLAGSFVYVLARIQHRAWAGGMGLSLAFGLVAVYSIWFLKKPAKRPADFLKLAWVGLHGLFIWGHLQHSGSPWAEWLPVLNTIVLFSAYSATYADWRRWQRRFGAGAVLPDA